MGYGQQDTQPVAVADVQRIAAKAKLVSLQSSYSAGFNLQLSSNAGRPHSGGLCFGDSGAGAGFSYRIDQPEILAWINSFL